MLYTIRKTISTASFFLLMTLLANTSFAFDSTQLTPPVTSPMHQKPRVDIKNSMEYQSIDYTVTGDQAVNPCPEDTALVHIQHASRQVFWGPPKSVCSRYGSCSDFGCWCAGSPHSCCAWCSPPCAEHTQVKWQSRPSNNQSTAIQENMPSVLSEAACAPIKMVWESI